jgi:hypothetical protein
MPIKRKIIPDQDHVVRYVSYARQARDDDDNLIGHGLHWSAFQQKRDEEFVSVNWLEYRPGTREERLKAVRADLSGAFPPRPTSKALLAIGNVGEIKRACQEANQPVRITHEPNNKNQSHAGIRRLPAGEDDLLETLAAEVFIDTLLASSL